MECFEGLFFCCLLDCLLSFVRFDTGVYKVNGSLKFWSSCSVYWLGLVGWGVIDSGGYGLRFSYRVFGLFLWDFVL